MLGCVYMFESEQTPGGTEQTVSMMATRAIQAGINERPGIHYQELTEPANPKPVFSVLFADAEQKSFFDILFGPAVKLCGLRVTALHASTEDEAKDEYKADLGYIDRERGYVIVIPSVRRLTQD